MDAPKQWWEDEQIFRPITEWTLQKNEWLDIGKDPDDSPSYTPQMISTIGDDWKSDRLNSEETDEEFGWFDPVEHTNDTYFTFVNKNRKTFMPGEQVFYCYGNRTNKFLLVNYGFCFPGNSYDSYEFPLRLDVPTDEIFVPEIVDLSWQGKLCQAVRLKKDQICEVMVAFLRSCCKQSFFSEKRQAEADYKSKKRILLTRPTNLYYEQYVFMYYLQILNFVQDQLNKVATLEEDLEMLQWGEPGCASD